MSKTFVQTFAHLKDRPKSDQALSMLQRIASLVKPIMRKHDWNLPILAEFFPESPNLLGLNINKGQKICLRLRPAHSPDTFYDKEDVIGTMLHELTHNVHGPHDEKFYKFLSGLQDEYDALQRSGYAGEGFFSNGKRVGTGISHDLPPHLARIKALEAAEKRRQTTQVLGRGGRLGGGAINTKGLSPRELPAQAAERRARDEKACGSGALAVHEAEKAARDSVEDKVIDLTIDDSNFDIINVDQAPPVDEPPKPAIPQPRAPTALAPTKAPHQTTPTRVGDHAPKSTIPASGLATSKVLSDWSCSVCTLLNGSLALQCDACFAERPPDPSAGWACLTCGETGISYDRWSCHFCGAIKTRS